MSEFILDIEDVKDLRQITMSKTYKIAVIPGDGTGPEVVREGLKVLEAASEKFDFGYRLKSFDFGGERYLKTKEVLPDGALDELKQAKVAEGL